MKHHEHPEINAKEEVYISILLVGCGPDAPLLKVTFMEECLKGYI